MNDHLAFEHWQELVAGFVIGDLDANETQELQRLLADRPELTLEVSQLQEVLRQVVEEGAAVEPSAHLCWEILHAIEQEESSVETSPQEAISPTFRPQWRKLWYTIRGAIAATAIGALGWHDYQVQQALDHSEKLVAMLQTPNTRIFQFRGMSAAKQASGSVMLNIANNRAAIAIRDLPVAQGKFYRLWAIVNADRKLLCRTTLPSDKAAIVNEFGISPDRFSELYHPQLKGFVVTVEDSPTTTQPAGAVVMSSI
jgi:anti-sigma-K factor RskA